MSSQGNLCENEHRVWLSFCIDKNQLKRVYEYLCVTKSIVSVLALGRNTPFILQFKFSLHFLFYLPINYSLDFKELHKN